MSGRVENLIQSTNERIEFLNSRLEGLDVNRFYEISHDPQKEHIDRMIKDLDFLVLHGDISSEEIPDAYLDVREKLMKLRDELETIEGQTSDK